MTEEDYIDVSELKTEEQAIKAAKKENFKSKFKSAFKSAGQKTSDYAKKGYASYKESRTPEAMERKLTKEKERLAFQKKKFAVQKERASLYKQKAKARKEQFQGSALGGLAMGSQKFMKAESGSKMQGKTPKGLGNPFGGGMGSPGGSMSNPFGGGTPKKGKKNKQKEMYNPFG